jgi:hypothetical protein
MAKDPAVLFYYQDFLVGTQFMTDAEVGKYMRLLCNQADKGRLTEKQMLDICKSQIPDRVREKFTVDESGLFYNERMEFERERRKKYSESRAKNRTYDKHMNNTSLSYDNHMETENENENEIENINKKRIGEILDQWNKFADEHGLAKIIKITDKRMTNIRQRLKEPEFNLEMIFQKIKQSSFLLGGKDWKIHFDFIFGSRNNYVKILEGNYDSNGNNNGHPKEFTRHEMLELINQKKYPDTDSFTMIGKDKWVIKTEKQ